MSNIDENILPTTSKRYEEALEKHLKGVNYELDVQLKELQSCLLQEKKKNVQKEENAHKQLFEILNRKFQSDKNALVEIEGKLARVKKKNEDYENKIENSRKSLEEQQKIEKQAQNKVYLKNIDISKLHTTTGISNLQNTEDSFTMRQSILKITKNLSSLYEEKKAQDSHLNQLRNDIQNAENELAQLAFLMSSLKNDASKNDSKLKILKDSIKTYEQGNLEIKDHWEGLIKKMNKSEPLENEKFGSQLSDTKLNPFQKEATDLQLKQISQQALIEKKESLNNILHDKLKHLKEKQERENLSDIKKNGTSSHKNLNLSKLEEVEEQLYFSNYLLENQKELLDQLKFLLNVKGNLVNKEELESQSRKNSFSKNNNKVANLLPSRQRFENKNLKNYQENRNSLVDLTRKMTALKYKKERFEKEKSEIQNHLKEKNQEIQSLRRKLEEVEEKRINLPKKETAINNESINEEVANYEKQLNELKMRKKKEKNSINNIKNEIEILRKKCEEYKSKIGDFQILEDIDRTSNHCLSQVHLLRNNRQSMKKEIQKIEKELEFVVLRRDHAVLGAKSAVGTNNQLRRERSQKNEELKQEIEELQRTIVEIKTKLHYQNKS